EPIRQYARARLEAAGEAEETARRHAACYLALAEAAEPELRGPGQRAWLGRLDREHENVRAALGWCRHAGESREGARSEAAERGARLAAALGWCWYMRCRLGEGSQWLEWALAASEPLRGETPALQARVLLWLGYLARNVSSCERAGACLERSLT